MDCEEPPLVVGEDVSSAEEGDVEDDGAPYLLGCEMADEMADFVYQPQPFTGAYGHLTAVAMEGAHEEALGGEAVHGIVGEEGFAKGLVAKAFLIVAEPLEL